MKSAEVERQLRLVAAVAQLARDAEAVLREELLGLDVAGRRRAVEQVDVVGPVLDAVPEDVDDAALRDLALQPREERRSSSGKPSGASRTSSSGDDARGQTCGTRGGFDLETSV